jgi:adenylylsulfate reductase, thioredoxin dependent
MINNMKEQLTTLHNALLQKNEVEGLAFLAQQFPNEIVFSTSFGLEDQAVSHLILANQIPISIFTLDTGRLFNETYSVWESTNERYHTYIQPYYPKANDIEEYVHKNGPLSFYRSVELRKECCHIRKVEPLSRALKGKKVWVTGLRADQSTARKDLPILEWDDTYHLFKYNPILHWTFEDTKAFIKAHNIPYNVLHDKGFVSIGCAPCTRAIKEGEDFRAGRWWWESNSKKECGLHEHKDINK